MRERHVRVNEAAGANLSNLAPKFAPTRQPVRLPAVASEKNLRAGLMLSSTPKAPAPSRKRMK